MPKLFYNDLKTWLALRAQFDVPEDLSFWQWLALQPEDFRTNFFESLTSKQQAHLTHAWGAWARSKQFPPLEDTGWDIWFVDAGRGFGKTRVGAEMVLGWAREVPGTIIHFIGRTEADVRDIMVDGGPSSILKIAPPDFRPIYEPSRARVLFPNGSFGMMFSSNKPDDLRGPQCHKMWCDEPASWIHAKECWDMALLGMRLTHPKIPDYRSQGVVTSTPKSNELIVELLTRAQDLMEIEGTLPQNLVSKRVRERNGLPLKNPALLVRLTRGSTYENLPNLGPSFGDLIQKYEGTRLGAQELHAELILDSPGALWKRNWIDDTRVDNPAPLIRTCIGVDPSGAAGENAAECGIIAVGISDQMSNSQYHHYVLGDASGRMTPAEWGRVVVELFVKMQANAIVAEKNFGGLMVEEVIRGAARQMGVFIPPVVVMTASKAKRVRAEPVAALYEGRPGAKEAGVVHHCKVFLELESELCGWDPGDKRAPSPNRLDALVWAVHWLNRWHEPQVAIY